MARWRSLAEEEKVLWDRVMNDVVPMHTSVDQPLLSKAAPTAGLQVRASSHKRNETASDITSSGAVLPQEKVSFLNLSSRQAVQVSRYTHPAENIGRRYPGIDDQSWRNFSHGKMKIQKRLDLHGMVAQEAFQRLTEFMDIALRQELRCVEIITGLGSGAEGGILRRELPFWLERHELRRRILGVVYPHAANRGSVRVLLRRRRA